MPGPYGYLMNVTRERDRIASELAPTGMWG